MKRSCLWVEIAFPSSPEFLSLVRSHVRWVCERAGFEEAESSRICLAIVEAVTNIIRHAYRGDPNSPILLRLWESEDGLEFELIDQGKSVAPADVATPERAGVQPGGLGVRLMKSCMDHFHYERRPEGGARLLLKKFRRRRPTRETEKE